MNVIKSWRTIVFEEISSGVEEALEITPQQDDLISFSIGEINKRDSGYLAITTTVGGLIALHDWLRDGLRYLLDHEEPQEPVRSITDEEA
jgi:hypothetical protein